jgi:ATP-dependent Zn protease
MCTGSNKHGCALVLFRLKRQEMITVRSFYRGPRTYLSRWDIEKMYGGAGAASASVVSDVEATSYHEAGHAVVRRALGRPVAEVFIANGGGGCRSVPARPWAEGDAAQAKLLNAVVSGLRPSARARNIFFNDLVSLAAGGIAQRRAGVDHAGCSSSDDLHKIYVVAKAARRMRAN